MEIKVTFNSAPSNYSKEEAIKIAQANKYTQEGSVYTIIFEKSCGDFIKLLKLSERWRVLEIFINGEEVNAGRVRHLSQIESPEGILSSIYLSDNFVFRSLSELKKEIKEAQTISYKARQVREKMETEGICFLNEITPNEFLIDKNILKEKIEDYVEKNYLFLSPHYDKKLIEEVVEDLPNKFKLPDEEAIKKSITQDILSEHEEWRRKKMEIDLRYFEEELRKKKEIEKKLEKEYKT